MVPREGESGLLAFNALGLQVFEVLSSRTNSDYGLDSTTSLTNSLVPRYFDQVLWGVPADSSHDPLRFKADSLLGSVPGILCDENGVPPTPSFNSDLFGPPSGPESATHICLAIITGQTGASSNSPAVPFTENPTSCGVPLTSTVVVPAYDGTTTNSSFPFPATTGCDQLSFNPSLAAKPTTTSSDSPSGLDAELSVPQYESSSVPSPSEIKATKMVLPPGFTINANAADGKTACADAEASFGTLEPAHCPEASKIGTLELHTALLPGPLPGYIYLGRPLPGDRYRVFLSADGFNVHVKLAGSISPDPATGQLTIVFNDLPETPFADFTLHVFGSERGSLATPTACGTYPVVTTFTPWDALLGEKTAVQHFTIDSGPGGGPCPPATRPFAPGFEAGSLSNAAGAHSPFSLDLTRPDGDQNLSRLSLTTPLGFSADLSGVPYCPQAAIDRLSASTYSGLAELESPACPAASQVGTLTASAGAGSKPLYVPGKLYLAGPYKGAPLSLLAVVPAVSGPYDLGVIAIRNAIEVNPLTAQVTTTSDPLPQILAGIPLRTRSLRVDVDRQGFARNPTNCDPLTIDARISADQGGLANPVLPFQVANCATLPYQPNLSIRLSGGINRLGHPAIHAVFSAKAGEANTRSVTVTLPKGELLDNSHIGSVCSKVDFAANSCPAGSRVGRAQVTTPLLDQPLAGSVYLRSSSSGLPDLALDLEGQLDIEAVGFVNSVDERYRTRFQTVPDVPVSEIDLDLAGGHRGLLQNSEGLCRARRFASMRLLGQNGRQLNRRVRIQLPCSHARHKRGLRRAAEAR